MSSRRTEAMRGTPSFCRSCLAPAASGMHLPLEARNGRGDNDPKIMFCGNRGPARADSSLRERSTESGGATRVSSTRSTIGESRGLGSAGTKFGAALRRDALLPARHAGPGPPLRRTASTRPRDGPRGDRPEGPSVPLLVGGKLASGCLLRPNELHRHGRRLHQRVVHRAALDHSGERLATGIGQTGSRHRDPDVAHPRRTVLAEIEVTLDDQPGRIETVPTQVPLRVEPDARSQPRHGQLRGRRCEVLASGVTPLAHSKCSPASEKASSVRR